MNNEHREQAREIEMIRERLSELTGLCGDHSCVFGPPKGMGTNGGCRCEVKRNPKVQQAIQLQRRLITLLSARDQEIKEVLEGLATHQIGSRRPCWCPPDYESEPHSAACLAARKLWEEVNHVSN